MTKPPIPFIKESKYSKIPEALMCLGRYIQVDQEIPFCSKHCEDTVDCNMKIPKKKGYLVGFKSHLMHNPIWL